MTEEGKKEQPDFIATKPQQDGDPTDNYLSPVDIGQDFTQAPITQDPIVPSEQ